MSKPKPRPKPNTCPHCGDRLKKIAGVFRCERDQYNAPFSWYPHEELKGGRMDTRPFDWLTDRVEPMIDRNE